MNMESDPNRNVGRSELSGELGLVSAPRETDPTLATIRPGKDRPPSWLPGHAHGKVDV